MTEEYIAIALGTVACAIFLYGGWVISTGGSNPRLKK